MTSAPESVGAPHGTPAHIARSPSPGLSALSDEAYADLHVTQRAIDSFVFHHGGDRTTAVVEIVMMVEDFAIGGAARESSRGFLALSRSGYEVVLSPDRGSVTAYATVHRERTWSQFKAGVPSRFGRRPVGDPPPPAGPAVVVDDLQQIPGLLDVERIRFTGSAYGRAERLAATHGLEGEAGVVLRRLLGDDVAAGVQVERGDNGAFLLRAPGRTWILREDLLLVIGVRPD